MNESEKRKKIASGRFSPLRYPGGKGKLARFLTSVIRENHLSDGLYVEPYAGGAAIACELLLKGVVRKIHINDLDPAIYSFWHSVVHDTEPLLKKIADTPITVDEWERQKRIFRAEVQSPSLALGFAMFFLNRTNRSGILNAGPIGGKGQSGNWKIDARFNKISLTNLISDIAQFSAKINVTQLDAVDLVKSYQFSSPPRTLIYFDPPYYEKGRHLYYNYYSEDDHKQVSNSIRRLTTCNWIVSYDDVEPIRALYADEACLRYQIGYSARNVVQGSEAMFFSESLDIPSVKGSMRETSRHPSASASNFSN